MKKYIYLMLSVVLAGIFASCSKDDPFDIGEDSATGQLRTSSLGVTLKSDYGPRPLKRGARRPAAPNVDDFTVEFYKAGKAEPVASYLYSKMPEIITLPVGDYTAKAFYGNNPAAAWEAPYYEGSTNFKIQADEITENVETIECTFANIRVSIYFDSVLKESMGPDCKVAVRVGESGLLDFTVADEYERSGYFAFVEGSNTLVATFSGTVDGVYTTENKTEIQVQKGKHYQIKFKMYDAGEEDPGSIRPGEGSDDLIIIDTEITSENIDSSVDSGETVIDDDMRPQEGDDEDPGKDDPKPDDPKAEGPSITARAPYDIDGRNLIELVDDDTAETGQSSKYPVVLEIHSDAVGGITLFEVVIDSDKITPSLLSGVGLGAELDLINPGDMAAGLKSLGFPIQNEVKGQSDVVFDITSFVPLLPVYGAAEHRFILKVADANGVTTKKFVLYNN